MASLAQFTPRTTGTDAQFVPSWADVTPPSVGTFGLLHDLDAGNANPFTAVLVDNATAPTARIVPRGPHIHWFFGLTGVLGKRPIVTVSNSTRQNSTAMLANWAPVYSYDQVTWLPFDSGHTVLAGPEVRFQHSTAFTSDTVYVADHPVFRYADFVALAATLNADASGRVRPSSFANSVGVIGVTPAETDALDRAVGGNPMWGFVLEDVSPETTDGGPRRELILTCGIHSGEIVDGWYLKGIIDWYLSGSGVEHARFRANFRILAYFCLTPNGRRSGHWRTNPTRGGDPNRDMVNFTLPESQMLRDALAADVTRGDVHFDMHSAASRTEEATVFRASPGTTEETSRLVAFRAAFNTIDGTPLADVGSSLTTTVRSHVRTVYSAFGLATEPGTRKAVTAARHSQVAVNYTRAVVAMDVDGLWWQDDGVSLLASLTASGTVTANLSAPSGAGAVLSAGLTASGTASASLSGGTAIYSGLLCPTLTLAPRYAPRVTLRSRCT